MLDCGTGVAGLQGLAQREELAIVRAQLVSPESVRRQMINFSYSRELQPVLNASNHILGLTMQPLNGNANQTPLKATLPMSSIRFHDHRHHLNSDPMP